MKHPLQKEIENDLNESSKLVSATFNHSDSLANEIATKYFKAITRINEICNNRNRY